MITHDLKALVFPIQGFSKLLKDPKILGELNAEQLDAVNAIFENSKKKMERLISDIHDVQKIEMNQIKLMNRSVDVNEMLNMISTSCRIYAIEKKIKFQINLPKEKFYVYGDVDRMFQVFLNLVRNAVDFVPVRDGKIEIGAIPQSKFVIFYVRDNGIGIATEKQEKLFHEFYQVEVVNQEKHSGSGLGLAICKGLIKKMKGRIWLESKQGEGTTIYFCLPREEA